MDSARPAVKGLRLRSYLLALVLATAIPAFMAAGFAVWRAAASYRDASTARLVDTSRALARGIESELENSETLVRTLAAAPPMGDVSEQGMRQWLSRAGLAVRGRVVAEQQDLALPPGSTELTPAGVPRRIAEAAVRSGRPMLSNLYANPQDQSPQVALSVPYTTPGQAPWVLSLVMHPQQLIRGAQAGQTRAEGLLVAVTDGEGYIVARSRDPERFVGKQVPDWAKLKAMGTDQGVFEARTAEGGLVIFAYQSLRGTPGWVVVTGEPLAAFNARWRQPLLEVAAWGGAAVLVALLLAAWLAGQIMRPVRLLAGNAQRIASDSPHSPRTDEATPEPALRIRELESLRASITEADEALRRRAEAERRSTEALAASERRYRTISLAGALVLWSANTRGELTGGTGWEVLTGQPDSEAMGRNWVKRLHPDDLGLQQLAQKEASQPPYRMDFEFRVRTVDEAWRWVRVRGAPVLDASGAITEWVGVIEDVDERRKTQARIAHMAHHDALTGLPNRTHFREQLTTAIQRARRGHQGAVLYIDLDHFKDVNDTLGHAVGDALLRAVTERLTAVVRSGDTVARLGGDEFVIAQSGVADPSAAADLAARVVTSLSAPYELSGHAVVIGASVGVTLITPDEDDPDGLLKKADMALYRAKEDGRGRHCFFEPEMDARMRERRRTELDLRRALAENEFEVRYQPLVDVRSRGLSGLQARLYWMSPDRGELQARDIVPLAEGMGLLVTMGEWLMLRACMDVAALPEVAKVAVKVTSTHLHHRSFKAQVIQALQRSGLAPHRLELELSEDAFLSNPEGMVHILGELKALGVRIVLDEFGSGHSALGCLRTFPFDKVKIAQSFVREVGVQREGDAIVRAIMALCDSLGIMSAAEGVESESQFGILSEEECTEAQGALFGGYRHASEIRAMCEAMAPRCDSGAVGPLSR